MPQLGALAPPTFSMSGRASCPHVCAFEEQNTICSSEETVSYYFKPLTGKGGKFSGGFDISSFGDLHSGKSMLHSSHCAILVVSLLFE